MSSTTEVFKEIFQKIPHFRKEFIKILNVAKLDHYMLVDDVDNFPHSLKNIVIAWFDQDDLTKSSPYVTGETPREFAAMMRGSSLSKNYYFAPLYLGRDHMIHVSDKIIKHIAIPYDYLAKMPFARINTVRTIYGMFNFVIFQINVTKQLSWQ